MKEADIHPRRVLITAEQWFGATGRGLAQGFRSLDWAVTETDPREHFILGRSNVLRFMAKISRNISRKSYNKSVISAAISTKPGLFFAVKGNYIDLDTLNILRSQGATTAIYYPDFHFNHPGVDEKSFTEYDLFFTTKSFQLDYLRDRLGKDRVRFLHHGYSPLVHRPRYERMAEDDYVADVLYVGNYSPYKQSWLEHVARNMPDVRLMIVGNGWSGPAAQFAPNADVIGQHVLGDGFARLLQSARINIAVHFGPTGPNEWEDLVSTRTFQIPACKGFMLHVDNAEVRSLFEPGREIDVFSTPDELCHKIRYYLDRPERRAEMIEAAYRRCVPDYSYDARAREIAEAVEALRGKR